MTEYKNKYREIHQIVDKNFDEQLAITQEVVRIRSVLDESAHTPEHPFGKGMSDALDDFLKRAASLGFRVKNVDNYVGYAEMGETGDLIGILAHLDVVPEGNAADWAHPPYAATVVDGALWGRGSIDNKGPAVAALYAMRALRDSGTPLKKRFRLILGLDEETGSRCITYYNEHEEIPTSSFSPDAEFPVVNAEKGIIRATVTKRGAAAGSDGATLVALSGGDRFNVVPDRARAEIACTPKEAADIAITLADEGDYLEMQKTATGVAIAATGVAAHAMEPHKGENAVQRLLSALKRIPLSPSDAELLGSIFALVGVGYTGDGLGIADADEVSGPLTCNLAAAALDKNMSVKLDIRYPVTADAEALLETLRNNVEKAGAEIAIHIHKKPLYMPEAHPTVQVLLDAYEAVTDTRPKPISMGGGTYCRFMPNAVSAGPLFPGEPELAHQPNEHVSLESLKKSTHIYAEALARFNERL